MAPSLESFLTVEPNQVGSRVLPRVDKILSKAYEHVGNLVLTEESCRGIRCLVRGAV